MSTLITQLSSGDSYYLGLDQALVNTGWALGSVNSKGIEVLDWGCFTTSRTHPICARLLSIERFIEQLLVSRRVQLVFTERVFINRPTAASLDLIRVETVIHSLLTRCNVDFKVISSVAKQKSSWRDPFKLTGDKKEALSLFSTKLDKLNQHSADAVGILLGGLVQHQIITLEQAINFNST